MDQKVVLSYWAIRGLAERIRLLLEYLGVPYDNHEITDRNEWFNKTKPSIDDPFINLPFLKDGEKVVSESEAIIAHIIFKANRADLFGKDSEQKVEVIKLRGAFNDMYSAYVRVVYGGGDFELTKPSLINSLSAYLEKQDLVQFRFEKYIGKKEYLTGELTYMDFLFADFGDVLQRLEPGLLKKFEGLHNLTERIWAIPAIAKYKVERFKPMPCNGPTAVWGNKAE